MSSSRPGDPGGIGANRDRPADLMLDNLLVAAHVIREAHAPRRLASCCTWPAPAATRGWRRSRCGVESLMAWAAGADQRRLRHRQAGRLEAVPGVPPAVWGAFHHGDSRQPVRPVRRFQPRRARHPRPDPADARGEAPRRGEAAHLGQRPAAARVPLRPRPGRRLPVCDATATTAMSRSTWAAAPICRSPRRPARYCRGRRLPRPADLRRGPARTGCRERRSTAGAAARWAGRPATDFRTALDRDVRLVSARHEVRGGPPRWSNGCIGPFTGSAESRKRSPASTRPTGSKAPSTCRSARRPCRSASARRCGPTTWFSAPTAATPSTWPRAAT